MAVYKQNSWGKKIDFVDIPEGSAPSNPSGDTARLYCKDSGGTTKLYYRDSSGNEREISYSAGTTIQYILLRDVKTSGTDGGTATSGSWLTRVLNEKTTDETGSVTLSSNQFTLPAGKYIIGGISPCWRTNAFKIKLRNISDSSDTLIGSHVYSYSSESSMYFAILKGQFTISAQKTFEIQYRCQNTYSDTGLGVSCGFGVDEIYTVVELWKIS